MAHNHTDVPFLLPAVSLWLPARQNLERISNSGHGESSGSALDFIFGRTTIQFQKRGMVEMVLTKQELTGALQNEVRLFLHLAGKIDRNKLDYRPTPKQRSTIELLRYINVMGPILLKAIKASAFDQEGFQAAMTEANAMNFDQVLGAIENQRGA